ncbi:MAG: hypothetical protein GY816_00785 [Cytophagales bacterium]|nr:hypothetical protein [Cytophagales bacterium]
MQKFTYILALFLSFSILASPSDGDKKNEKGSDVNTSQPITYVIGIVKRGENWEKDSLRAFELQEQHLKFIESLIANNKLMASGPLTTSSGARGLYVFNVKTIRDAQALTSKDVAMSSGWISMDFHVWKSRDYSIPEVVTEVEEESGGLGIKVISITFAVVILIFVLRTFRYKANV